MFKKTHHLIPTALSSRVPVAVVELSTCQILVTYCQTSKTSQDMEKIGGMEEKSQRNKRFTSQKCYAKQVVLYFRPFTIDESLKALLPLMTMVNELWSNHSSSTKHRRKPNGTLRHNTLIKAHLQSALPLCFPFVLLTFDSIRNPDDSS